jgi:glucose-1-phosphate thymidylyltransferase
VSDKAVILAAGLGTRMRDAGSGVELSGAQRAAAGRGIKAMIPVGRPFLDYVLTGLADAGIREVGLVVAPEHDEIRSYYTRESPPSRLRIQFATQERPRGTADAVLAAEPFAAGDSVLMLNADNLYPRAALEALRGLPRAGLAGFRRSGLLRGGNIPPERIGAFALIEATPDGRLARIVEKPDEAEARSFGADPLVSMNAWLLPPSIYDACRAVEPSSRGELELQDAVRLAIERLGERFRVLEFDEGVLDLSRPADIPAVTERLRGVEVRF